MLDLGNILELRLHHEQIAYAEFNARHTLDCYVAAGALALRSIDYALSAPVINVSKRNARKDVLEGNLLCARIYLPISSATSLLANSFFGHSIAALDSVAPISKSADKSLLRRVRNSYEIGLVYSRTST